MATKVKVPIKAKKLLINALTHRSWLNENGGNITTSNERLEFLGDAVLELIATEYLFHKFPDTSEGLLTAYRAALVRTETLASVAKTLDLGKLMLLSHGEEVSGGRENESLLANAFEAVVGAIYLESGKEKAALFIRKYLFPKLDEIQKMHLEKDAKSLLQEKVQADGHQAPTYTVLGEVGPDHNKIFTVGVFINGERYAQGTGKSKQLAQQQAAKSALEKYESS
jgi:ribonuclease-3